MVSIHGPYTYAYWIWHPSSNLSIKLEGDNIIPYRFEQETGELCRPAEHRDAVVHPGRGDKDASTISDRTAQDILNGRVVREA